MTGATDRAAQLHERAGARIHTVGGNVGGTRSRIPFLRYDLPMHTIVKREIARGPLRLGALCTLLLAGALAINAALPAAVFDAPIATRIEMDKRFYPAEAYHQDFLALNPSDGYIVVNDLPKIDHLRSLFPQRYREQPVLVAARAH
jgi:hypothetical protein